MPKQTRASEQQEQKSSTRRQADKAPQGPAPDASRLQRLPENPAAASPADVAGLQARYGNRAVQSLLASHTVQAKLQVGPANDRYEQEADNVAQQVMRMPEGKEDEEEKSGA